MSEPEDSRLGSELALLPLNGSLIQLLIDNQSHFMGFLRKRISSPAVAEDLLQQAFYKAIKGEAQLTNKENIVMWFYRILRNILTDYYRSRAAEDRKNKGSLIEMSLSGNDHMLSLDMELKKELCACIHRLIPALKPEYANLIQRIDLEEEPPSQVAESSGITYNNLMVRLHRARQALRVSLERTCGVCTKHGCLDCTCETMTQSRQVYP